MGWMWRAHRHVAERARGALVRHGEAVRGPDQSRLALHAGHGFLRILVWSAGVSWAVLFVTVGPAFELHFYGDGSAFSYAVAVESTWAIHWHNIPARAFVHLFAHVPAETYIAVTGDASRGVAIYGLLFFSAPLLGLVATYVADSSMDRTVFTFACLSTACLAPLVFGFPTEMWIAHSVFWPALAVLHYACRDTLRAAAGSALLLALVFTHEGALILAIAILATLLLRGARDFSFVTAAAAYLVILCLWVTVKLELPPDEYFSSVILTAALNFLDVTALADGPILLMVKALGCYAAFLGLLWRVSPSKAHVFATLIIAVALTAHWLWLDNTIHAANRYAFRTALVVVTPVLGALAGFAVVRAQGRLAFGGERLSRLRLPIHSRSCLLAGPAAGALVLITMVHAIETAKFINAWTKYKAAVRTLVTASNPTQRDLHVVSAVRIGDDLNRLSWSSTTPYLSVLAAPGFQPKRLVVEPEAEYHWLSCQVATASYEANRSISKESRRLVREQACLRRPY